MADAPACRWNSQIPCVLSKALRKSEHEFQKKTTLKLIFFDMNVQFFVECIKFIDNFISNISKWFCVPSKTLKKEKKLGISWNKLDKIGDTSKNRKKQELHTLKRAARSLLLFPERYVNGAKILLHSLGVMKLHVKTRMVCNIIMMCWQIVTMTYQHSIKSN